MSNNQTQRPASQPVRTRQPAGTPAAPRRRRRTVGEWIALNRKNLERYLMAIAVFAVAITLLANIVSKNREFSDTENRSLTQFPKLSVASLTDGTWFRDVNNWYNDQFFARDSWISLHLQELKLFGQKESGGVFLGKKGYLMLRPEEPVPEAMAGSVEAINRLAAEHPELNTTMMVVPDSATTMKKKLPAFAPARDQNEDIRGFEAQLDSSIHCIDVGEVLSEHTDEYIYYQTDHHWTSLGAFYAFQSAVDTLNIREYVTDFEVYTVTNDFRGTLSSKSGSRSVSDSIDIYLPVSDVTYYVTRGEDHNRNCSIYNSEALDVSDKYTVFFGGNYSKVDIQTTANNGRVLLLFKDSYANSFVQFLLPCYQRIIMVDPRYYYGTMEELLNFGVTDVLYLYAADTVVTTTTLKDVLNSRAAQESGASTDALAGAMGDGEVPAASDAAQDAAPVESTETTDSNEDEKQSEEASDPDDNSEADTPDTSEETPGETESEEA